jgi:hypothetical protein
MAEKQREAAHRTWATGCNWASWVWTNIITVTYSNIHVK